LFFVSVGMLFDPSILVERPLQVLAVWAIIVFGKSAAAYFLVRAFGKDNSTALLISASLAQIGEFSFILAALGMQLEILPREGHDLVLAGALLSIITNPLIFAWLDRGRARAAMQATRDAADAATAADHLAPGIPEDLSGHVISIGYGRVGSELGRLLTERDVPVVVIDTDTDLIRRARENGIPAIRGNAASDAVLREAAPERATTVMLAIPNVLEAGEIIGKLRAINPALTIVARAHSDGEVKHLLERGADGAVMAERELAHSLAEMVMATPPYRGSHHLPPAVA